MRRCKPERDDQRREKDDDSSTPFVSIEIAPELLTRKRSDNTAGRRPHLRNSARAPRAYIAARMPPHAPSTQHRWARALLLGTQICQLARVGAAQGLSPQTTCVQRTQPGS